MRKEQVISTTNNNQMEEKGMKSRFIQLKKEIRSGIIRSTYGSDAYEHYLFCSRYRYFRSNTAA